MARISDREIHQLYGPAYRRIYYPSADWSFLVLAARNLANAIETIHAHNHVIGDLNEGNVVVSARSTVTLIDCDSFQLQINGHVYPCEVGVANFTPPELQKRSFRGVSRTVNHDNFGLAVLVFHLLFMGRHPFAGRFLANGDMPIEKAIYEFRFAFGRSAAGYQMAPPPFAPKLIVASARIADLFERAFSPESARAGGRPTASQWVGALDALTHELKTCPTYPAHKYHHTLAQCPWCEIERTGGPDFFISLTTSRGAASFFDVDRVWQTIITIPGRAESFLWNSEYYSQSAQP
jgi:DNA-binding helix-hairpin-helix protein with protein kinase domain